MQHCKKVDTDLKSHEAAEALPGEFRPLTATDTHRQHPEPYLGVSNIAVPRTELEEFLVIFGQNSLIMTGPFSKGLS